MGRLRILLITCVVAVCSACGREVPAEDGIAVVPVPVQMTQGKGVFLLTASTPLCIDVSDDGMRYVAEALDEVVRPLFGRGLRTVSSCGAGDGAIHVALDASCPSGVYRLAVTPRGVDIRSATPEGAFHAVQTLRQLLPVTAYGGGRVGSVELPVVEIEDRPVMAYRGLMLDVARHFFTVEEVKRTLDLMAMHKMNVFHWHLTDDQGWRLEICKYPELTRIGSVRRRTLIGKDPGGEYDETCRYDETPYGGYYTQEEVREVVDYAARRFITVIPEIEFPGHAVAALASYPWLGCTGEQYEVRQTWDIDDRVFCVGRDSTFRFIEQVLDEVIGLFPSTYIHVGGDECPTKMWEQCPQCRARMRAEGLATPRQLQGYAMARIERFLLERGRRMIGWDEILEGGVTPTAVVMSWRGTEGGIRAARQGNKVVMSPSTYCYLDYYQTEDTAGEPLAWGGFLPLRQVYAFDPYEGLDSLARSCVLGVQGNLWTEYIPDYRQAQYMLLPRLGAVAEVGWAPEHKDYDDFLRRMTRMRDRYAAWGYVCAPHPFEH